MASNDSPDCIEGNVEGIREGFNRCECGRQRVRSWSRAFNSVFCQNGFVRFRKQGTRELITRDRFFDQSSSALDVAVEAPSFLPHCEFNGLSHRRDFNVDGIRVALSLKSGDPVMADQPPNTCDVVSVDDSFCSHVSP